MIDFTRIEGLATLLLSAVAAATGLYSARATYLSLARRPPAFELRADFDDQGPWSRVRLVANNPSGVGLRVTRIAGTKGCMMLPESAGLRDDGFGISFDPAALRETGPNALSGDWRVSGDPSVEIVRFVIGRRGAAAPGTQKLWITWCWGDSQQKFRTIRITVNASARSAMV